MSCLRNACRPHRVTPRVGESLLARLGLYASELTSVSSARKPSGLALR